MRMRKYRRVVRGWRSGGNVSRDERLSAVEHRVELLWEAAGLRMAHEQSRIGRDQLTLGRLSLVAGVAVTLFATVLGGLVTLIAPGLLE